ncbi:MAG: cytochrome c domain protein [Alphaproteobacteria bacterium]|nr:cytochrome c domain protein [Alphaproteobacteria bacterium]
MSNHNLEFNKILAAILVAGIVAKLAGFAAERFSEPHELEKPVIAIDTSALESAGSGGPAAPTGPEPILALLGKADIAKGQALAKACLACHDFSKGGPNKIGPNLWGIVNNKKAHAAGFAYSDTIKDMADKGDHWGYKNLNSFLWKPAVYAKGTKMTYPGLKKPEDRAAVIGYLRTLADTPEPLPTEQEIASEMPVDAAPAPESELGKKADAPAPAPASAAKVDNPLVKRDPAAKPKSEDPQNSGTQSAPPMGDAKQHSGDQDQEKPMDPARDTAAESTNQPNND